MKKPVEVEEFMPQQVNAPIPPRVKIGAHSNAKKFE
jgi:hypothetical protein